ncbi:MAG: tail fiber domain-containing protein [Patescibacteria group bacterium]|nr:tail fiber domain-containing protein [Patescibacteria group bacterium]
MKSNNQASRLSKLTLLVAFLCVFSLIGLRVARAAWNYPTDAAPGGNVAAPINVSGAAQTKLGSLTIDGESFKVSSGNVLISTDDRGIFWSDSDDPAKPHLEEAGNVVYLSPGEEVNSRLELYSQVKITNAGANNGSILIDNGSPDGKKLEVKAAPSDAGVDIKSIGVPLFLNFDDGELVPGAGQDVRIGQAGLPANLCLNDSCIQSWQTATYTANNGLTLNGNIFELGGTLNRATTITQGANNLTFNLDGAGEFLVQDSGANKFRVAANGDVYLPGVVGCTGNSTLDTDASGKLLCGPDQGGAGGTDELVKVSSNDTTAGYLNGKLVAGTNITLTELNNGANETLRIDATGGGGDSLWDGAAGDHIYPLQSASTKVRIGWSNTGDSTMLAVKNSSDNSAIYAEQNDPDGFSGYFSGKTALLGTGSIGADQFVTVRNEAFDYVFAYNGSAYLSNATEAKISGGVPYGMLNNTNWYFYVGRTNAPFNSIFFDLATAGAGMNLSFRYWNGSSWTSLSAVNDGTNNFSQDGLVTYTFPANWQTTNVNGISGYWVRVNTSVGPSTGATAYLTVPHGRDTFSVFAQAGDSIPTLLVNKYANVGIGTDAPQNLLETAVLEEVAVNNDVDYPLRLTHRDTFENLRTGMGTGLLFEISATGAENDIGRASITSYTTDTHDDTRLTLATDVNGTLTDSLTVVSGNVGVNQVAPVGKLVVNNNQSGTGGAGDAIATYANTTSSALYAQQNNTAGYAGYFSGRVGISTYLQLGTDSGGNTYYGSNIKWNGTAWEFVNPSGAYNGGGSNPSRGVHLGMTSVLTVSTGQGNTGGDTDPHLTEKFRITNDGKVGIGDPSPASLLTVGNNDLFQVNSSGDLIKIKNISYVWPASQGGANTYLKNDGSGNLTWATAGGTGTDELVKVSSNDTTAGYLNGKLVAGSNITLTELNNGANETLQISATGGSADNLGNHTATQRLKMNGNWITNDGDADEGLKIDDAGLVRVGSPSFTAGAGSQFGVAGSIFATAYLTLKDFDDSAAGAAYDQLISRDSSLMLFNSPNGFVVGDYANGGVPAVGDDGLVAEGNAYLATDTGKKVGIGTIAPDQPLHIARQGADMNTWLKISVDDTSAENADSSVQLGAVSSNNWKETQLQYDERFGLYDKAVSAWRLSISDQGETTIYDSTTADAPLFQVANSTYRYSQHHTIATYNDSTSNYNALSGFKMGTAVAGSGVYGELATGATCAAGQICAGVYGSASNVVGTGATVAGIYGSATGTNSWAGYFSGADIMINGIRAGRGPASSESNTVFGNDAFTSNNGGGQNVAIGRYALKSSVTGSYNVAVGLAALQLNTDDANTAIGYTSLEYNTTGSDNTAVGEGSLNNNTTGTKNTALGYRALMQATTGGSNTAVGDRALFYTGYTTGNTAVGAQALMNNTNAENSALGYKAAFATTGSMNTAIGYEALITNTSGSWNTALGYQAGPNAAAYWNTTSLGNGAQATQSDMVRVGNASVTLIRGHVAWSTDSDLRLKKDIQDSALGLSFINKLRPVQYSMINGNGKTDYGFIAQDIEKLVSPDEVNLVSIENDENQTRSLRYDDLIAPMVKAIQEQNQMIEKQQQEIDNLTNRLNSLEQ